MPRLNQTSFTGGELSPRALGRTDLDRYFTAARKMRNAHPVIAGPAKRRDGSLYVANAQSNVAAESVLVPFVKGRDQAWMLEFANLTCRIYTAAGVLVTTLTSPFSLVHIGTMDWAQSEATMYLFHPNVPPQRLQLLGTGTWVLSAAPFTTIPFAEVGEMPGTAITLSNATVGTGRTATASAASFLAADVGRAIVYDAGIAVITAFTSTTVVTVEITRAFPSVNVPLGQWTLEGTPQTTCTPGAKDPVGASITLVAGANAWRSTYVGAMLRINSGLLKITNVTDALNATGVIVRELTSTVAAPALAWSIEPPIWSSAYGYPRTGTVHQQRLIAAGTSKFPRTVWGSRLGEPLDFELGTTDDLAFSFTIDSDDASAIAWVSSARDLVVLTESGEYTLRSGVEKPITPTNVRVIPESNHGSAAVRPVQIGAEVLFVQRAGRKMRAMGYRYDFDAYRAPDITALVDHMTKPGLGRMTFQQEPDLMLWVVQNDGGFLTCTIDRDQQPSVIGWAQHSTQGSVESVASIPNGDREQVWAIVRRTINGAAVRLIERFDGTIERMHPSESDDVVYGCTVDCGSVIDSAGGQATFTVAHLPNTVVRAVADGSEMGNFTTNGSGQFTLPRNAKRVIVGLHFDSEVELLTPEFGTNEGSAQGSAARTNEIVLRFLDTIGAKVKTEDSEQTVAFRQFGQNVLDQPPQPFTGLIPISTLGWGRTGPPRMSIVQRQALPFTLLAVIRQHTA